MDAAAHTRLGSVQRNNELYTVRNLVYNKDSRNNVYHNLVQVDVPPSQNRPAYKTGVEIPVADRTVEPSGNDAHGNLRMAFLENSKN